MMCSQYPMYAMAGNQMMAVMPTSSGENPTGVIQGSPAGMPQIINANSLSASLPQNGPFVLMPSGGMPQMVAPRPSAPTTSNTFQDKKK